MKRNETPIQAASHPTATFTLGVNPIKVWLDLDWHFITVEDAETLVDSLEEAIAAYKVASQ